MFSLNPSSNDFINSCDLLLKITGGSGAVIVFIIGFRRYTKAQLWKKREFVAKEIKAFNNDKTVRCVLYMLDWSARSIELFPDEPDYKQRFTVVSRATLNRALYPHNQKNSFSDVEVAIRDHFDHFLAYFEKFQQFVDAKLIDVNELEPYLRYWIKLICHGLGGDVGNTLRHYIGYYGFEGTQQLFAHFGQDIRPLKPLGPLPEETDEEE